VTGFPMYPPGYAPLDMLRFVERINEKGSKVRVLQQFLPRSGVGLAVRLDADGYVQSAQGIWIDVPLLEES